MAPNRPNEIQSSNDNKPLIPSTRTAWAKQVPELNKEIQASNKILKEIWAKYEKSKKGQKKLWKVEQDITFRMQNKWNEVPLMQQVKKGTPFRTWEEQATRYITDKDAFAKIAKEAQQEREIMFVYDKTFYEKDWSLLGKTQEARDKVWATWKPDQRETFSEIKNDYKSVETLDEMSQVVRRMEAFSVKSDTQRETDALKDIIKPFTPTPLSPEPQPQIAKASNRPAASAPLTAGTAPKKKLTEEQLIAQQLQDKGKLNQFQREVYDPEKVKQENEHAAFFSIPVQQAVLQEKNELNDEQKELQSQMVEAALRISQNSPTYRLLAITKAPLYVSNQLLKNRTAYALENKTGKRAYEQAFQDYLETQSPNPIKEMRMDLLQQEALDQDLLEELQSKTLKSPKLVLILHRFDLRLRRMLLEESVQKTADNQEAQKKREDGSMRFMEARVAFLEFQEAYSGLRNVPSQMNREDFIAFHAAKYAKSWTRLKNRYPKIFFKKNPNDIGNYNSIADYEANPYPTLQSPPMWAVHTMTTKEAAFYEHLLTGYQDRAENLPQNANADIKKAITQELQGLQEAEKGPQEEPIPLDAKEKFRVAQSLDLAFHEYLLENSKVMRSLAIQGFINNGLGTFHSYPERNVKQKNFKAYYYLLQSLGSINNEFLNPVLGNGTALNALRKLEHIKEEMLQNPNWSMYRALKNTETDITRMQLTKKINKELKEFDKWGMTLLSSIPNLKKGFLPKHPKYYTDPNEKKK